MSGLFKLVSLYLLMDPAGDQILDYVDQTRIAVLVLHF